MENIIKFTELLTEVSDSIKVEVKYLDDAYIVQIWHAPDSSVSDFLGLFLEFCVDGTFYQTKEEVGFAMYSLDEIIELLEAAKHIGSINDAKKDKPKRCKYTAKGEHAILTITRPGDNIKSLEVAETILSKLLESPEMRDFTKLTKIININMF